MARRAVVKMFKNHPWPQQETKTETNSWKWKATSKKILHVLPPRLQQCFVWGSDKVLENNPNCLHRGLSSCYLKGFGEFSGVVQRFQISVREGGPVCKAPWLTPPWLRSQGRACVSQRSAVPCCEQGCMLHHCQRHSRSLGITLVFPRGRRCSNKLSVSAKSYLRLFYTQILSSDLNRAHQSGQCAPKTQHPRNVPFLTKLNFARPKSEKQNKTNKKTHKQTFQIRIGRFKCIQRPETGEADLVGINWDKMVNTCPVYNNSCSQLQTIVLTWEQDHFSAKLELDINMCMWNRPGLKCWNSQNV